jgi:hypothetical protein
MGHFDLSKNPAPTDPIERSAPRHEQREEIEAAFVGWCAGALRRPLQSNTRSQTGLACTAARTPLDCSLRG